MSCGRWPQLCPCCHRQHLVDLVERHPLASVAEVAELASARLGFVPGRPALERFLRVQSIARLDLAVRNAERVKAAPMPVAARLAREFLQVDPAVTYAELGERIGALTGKVLSSGAVGSLLRRWDLLRLRRSPERKASGQLMGSNEKRGRPTNERVQVRRLIEAGAPVPHEHRAAARHASIFTMFGGADDAS